MAIVPNRPAYYSDDYYINQIDREYEDFPWDDEETKLSFYNYNIKVYKENDNLKQLNEIRQFMSNCIESVYSERISSNDIEDVNFIKSIYDDKMTLIFYLYDDMMKKYPEIFQRRNGDYFIVQPK